MENTTKDLIITTDEGEKLTFFAGKLVFYKIQLHEVENDAEFAELETVLQAYDEAEALKALEKESEN